MEIVHTETGQPAPRWVVLVVVAEVVWGVASIVSWLFPWLFEFSFVFHHPVALILSIVIGFWWLVIAEGFWLGRESADEVARQLGAAFAILTCLGGIVLIAVAMIKLLTPGTFDGLMQKVIEFIWVLSQETTK